MDISFSPLLIIDFLFPHEIVRIKKDIISISSLFENLYGIDIGSNSMKDFLLYSKNLSKNYPFDEYRLYLNECFNLYKKKFEALNFVNKISNIQKNIL